MGGESPESPKLDSAVPVLRLEQKAIAKNSAAKN
jgi:hypothetical protein